MLELGESTVHALIFDPLQRTPPAIVYSQHETPQRSVWDFAELLTEQVAYQTKKKFAVVAKTTSQETQAVTIASEDAWWWNTVDAITAHRNLPAGWLENGIDPPSERALDVAEILATGFADLPINRRPQFGVDGEGRASYSAYESGFYLHLTIDQYGLASWYSVEGTDEVYRDEVVVDALTASALAKEIMSA